MSVSYNITNEGTPIIPVQMDVVFDVNVAVHYEYPVNSTLDPQSQAFQDFFAAYVSDIENSVKETDTIFSTRDTNRNATFSLTPVPGVEGSYTISIDFTIENAVATVSTNTQTNLSGEAKDEFLLNHANYIASYEKSNRPWTDL